MTPSNPFNAKSAPAAKKRPPLQLCGYIHLARLDGDWDGKDARRRGEDWEESDIGLREWALKGSGLAAEATFEQWRALAREAVKESNEKLLKAMAAWGELATIFSENGIEAEAGALLCRAVTIQPNAGIASALIQLGCQANWVNEDGDTLLLIASRKTDGWKREVAECAAILIPFSDVDAQESVSGKTALINAVETRNLDLLEMLAPVANVNIQSAQGWTALHYAARSNWGEAIACVAKRANFNLRNQDGHTALDLAIQHGHCGAADTLMSMLPAKEAAARAREAMARVFPKTMPLLEAAEEATALEIAAEAGREIAAAQRALREAKNEGSRVDALEEPVAIARPRSPRTL